MKNSDPNFSRILSLTAGPDNHVWFTDAGTNSVGYIADDGTPNYYSLDKFDVTVKDPDGKDNVIKSTPSTIIKGSDGKLWFTAPRIGSIGSVTLSDDADPVIEMVKLSTGQAYTGDTPFPTWNIAEGSDKNFWVTLPDDDKVCQVGRDGTTTEFTTTKDGKSLIDTRPLEITSDTKGNIWFTESQGNHISEIDLHKDDIGIVQYDFPMPRRDDIDPPSGSIVANPIDILQTKEGKIWFTEGYGCAIGTITDDGKIKEHLLSSFAKIRPIKFAEDKDGNFWFTGEDNVPAVGLMTSKGEYKGRYRIPGAEEQQATSIIRGPDDNIWLYDQSNHQILSIPTTSFSLLPPDGIQIDGMVEGRCGHYNLATYLNAHLNDAAISEALTPVFSLTGPDLDRALTSISPHRLVAETKATANLHFSLNGLIASHLQENRGKGFALSKLPIDNTLPQSGSLHTPNTKKKTPFWASSFGHLTYEKAQNMLPAFSAKSAGLYVGYDYPAQDASTTVLGGGLGYARNNLSYAHKLGVSSADACLASLYMGSIKNNLYYDASVVGSYSYLNSKRDLMLSDTAVRVHSNSHAWMLTPHLEMGYNMKYAHVTVEPFVAVDYSLNWASRIREKGDFALKMDVRKHHSAQLKSKMGLSFYEEQQKSWGLIGMRQTLAYTNKKSLKAGRMVAAVSGATDSFEMDLCKNTQNLFAPALEVSFKHTNGQFFSLTYQGEFGSGFASNEARGEIGIAF
jgi:virginiamycin B lyase